MTPAEHPPANRGFTLLEILVALIVFALAFGVLAQIVQTGFRQSASAEATTDATLLARSLLERVGSDVAVAPARYRGETGAGLRWRTDIAPAELELEDQGVAAYVVRVTVAWGPPESARSVDLTTLRLGDLP